MDWLFENLGKIVSFVAFILYILASFRSKEEEEEQREDPDAAERARKIQEEIRRKILDRQKKSQPSEQGVEEPETFYEQTERYEDTRPDPAEVRRYEPERPEPTLVFEEEPAVPVPEADPYAEQKRQIQEQMEKAKKLREKADRIRKEKAPQYGDLRERSISFSDASSVRGMLDRNLRSSDALKSAFVTKEILDRPLGLH